ncbi:hypothetical protein Pcinc_033889 [Petrolisthes cinctipes]|uniref:SAM-dependent MTase RsmB/NOP-type domain-containing protein n=1 Tax=Petrolisthes cinctipes TaxID=88211 RepID=A0AAE1ERA0_PETCI|nr:hypothetical protein Pcinc_033889 [Petrolisthes cinctipes]
MMGWREWERQRIDPVPRGIKNIKVMEFKEEDDNYEINQLPMEDKMTDKKPHSIPVPRLYKLSSKILRRYENKEGTLKNLVYSANHPHRNSMMALLSKTVDQGSVIKSALADSKILEKEPGFNPYLAQVLTAELLTKGCLQGDCKPIIVLRKYEDELLEHYRKNAKKMPPKKKKVPFPRYVRINTLVATADDVHNQLAEKGWILYSYKKESVTYDDYLDLVENLEGSTYMEDYHIPELLVFPPNTPFWNSELYKENAIVLMDKASCLPVFLASIKPGYNIIDGCAAPGNKTSYMAATINNTGSITALDNNPERFKTLNKLVQQRGATCVSTLLEDFTKLNPDQYPDVRCIFLDPTCTGSGVGFHQDKISEQRVRNLASFQSMVLKHALSFPSVKKVIYSTCSVMVEENEEVVKKALDMYQHQFKLADIKKRLPGWKNFGCEDYSFSKKVCKTNPDVDKCQGFFVAKFVRKEKSTCSEDMPDSSAQKEGEKRKKQFNEISDTFSSKKKKSKKEQPSS